MFQRFTESARRLLFFARYEVSQQGAVSIEPVHLLLAFTRLKGSAGARLLEDSQVPLQDLRDAIERRTVRREKIPTSVELPFSEETKRVLIAAVEEADALEHSHVGSEHLLLGIIREGDPVTASILGGYRLRLDVLRTAAARLAAERPPDPPSPFVLPSDRIEEMKTLVDRLAGMAANHPEAPALAERIRAGLETLKAQID